MNIAPVQNVIMKTEVSALPLGSLMRKFFLLTVEYEEQVSGVPTYQVYNSERQILGNDWTWGAKFGHPQREIAYRQAHTFSYDEAIWRAGHAAMNLVEQEHGITVQEALATVGMEYWAMIDYLNQISRSRSGKDFGQP